MKTTCIKLVFYTVLLFVLMACGMTSTTDNRSGKRSHDMGDSTIWEKITNSNFDKQLYKAILADTTTIITNGMFDSCDSLGAISIPNSVRIIGEGAFAKSHNIDTIIIPEGVTSIGNFAFFDCPLEYISIPSSVTHIGRNMFGIFVDGATLSKSVHFSGVNFLVEDAMIFNGDKSVIYEAFQDEIPTTLRIPNSVEHIGEGAFMECFNLAQLILPPSLKTIEDRAFDSCHSLTSINLSNSITYIGENAFSDCDSLRDITLPPLLTTISDYTFYRCGEIKKIIIPSKVTSIGERAFFQCVSLEDIRFPAGLKTIENCAFMRCSRLKTLSLPDGLTTIAGGAFYDCSQLESIDIPSSVTTIGKDAFAQCENLKSIYINKNYPLREELTERYKGIVKYK